MSHPIVGAPAPWPTGLTDQDGTAITLSAYAGKHVLLYFYPKDDTPGCTIEACNFRDHAPDLPGVAVLGASLDNATAHQAFRAKFNLPFPLVVDPKQELAQAYGVLAPGSAYPSRSSFLIGPDGKLKAVWPKVDPKSHWLDVKNAVG